jgi:hypothetical protein
MLTRCRVVKSSSPTCRQKCGVYVVMILDVVDVGHPSLDVEGEGDASLDVFGEHGTGAPYDVSLVRG